MSFEKAKQFTEEEKKKIILHIDRFQIGSHLPKLKNLVLTVQQSPPTKPMQIFLGNPQSTNLKITDAELAAAFQVIGVSKAQVYIHSPYIINLSSNDSSYQLDCLIKCLKYGAAMGAKGVVVHVGKYTKQDPEKALETMMENLLKVAEEATLSCPLLLETPAGQGTELLTKPEDFVGCIKGLDHPNLKICVDTCHTFACGHNPLTYIQNILTESSNLIKLIHYNDSKAPCGSRVDRHAFCGSGEIGFVLMEKIAKVCSEAKLPMVIE
jgi:deoxyribonuclease-4